MQNYNPKSKRGFTLIELLVVIAIIGLLATIVAVAVSSVQKKTRDTKRRTDLKEVQMALELYRSAYGIYTSYPYPKTDDLSSCEYDSSGGGGYWCGACPSAGNKGTSGSIATAWVPDIAPNFLSKLPTDPKPMGTDKCYLYRSNGADFKLLAHQTVENCTPGTGVLSSDSMYDPQRSGQCTFAIYTLDAVDW